MTNYYDVKILNEHISKSGKTTFYFKLHYKILHYKLKLEEYMWIKIELNRVKSASMVSG